MNTGGQEKDIVAAEVAAEVAVTGGIGPDILGLLLATDEESDLPKGAWIEIELIVHEFCLCITYKTAVSQDLSILVTAWEKALFDKEVMGAKNDVEYISTRSIDCVIFHSLLCYMASVGQKWFVLWIGSQFMASWTFA